MDILEALGDPKLLAPLFAPAESWAPWRIFLAAVYGLPLDSAGVALFCKATGRSSYDPPLGGWPEVAVITGRQSGKSRIAATLAVFEAAVALAEPDGSTVYCALVAQDARSAQRVLFEYARVAIESSPLLRQAVDEQNMDRIRLRSGITLGVYPCRPSSLRGIRCRVAICDELAFFVGFDLRRTDTEMLRALRPCLATTGGKLVVLSSPYAAAGALWELHRRHFGRDDSETLVWQSSAPEMNPALSRAYVERMRRDDLEAFASEVDGRFRSGLSSLFDPDALEACVARGRRELPAVEGIAYEGFTDPSGGRSDAFTVSIGHRDGERIVVDLARAWRAPFNPSSVVAECAELLKRYRVSTVVGDRYAGEWPREAFRGHGIEYKVAERDRSALYLELLAAVNSARIELPDDPGLLRELRGLERRRGAAGRDRVDHASGAHDDRANALAGVAHLLAAPAFFFGDSFNSRYSSDEVIERERVERSAERMRERLERGGGFFIPGRDPW